MKWPVIAALLLMPVSASAQLNGCKPGICVPASAAAAPTAPFAIDGTPQTANSSSSNLALPAFSTTRASDVIVIAVITNGTTFPSSFTTGGLTFNRETGLTPPVGGGSTIDLFSAVAVSPLSAAVFTLPNSSAYTTGLVFALSGAKTSAPFDVNAAIPATTTSNTVPAATITTSAANTFGFGIAVTNSADAGTGFTLMSSAAQSNYLELNYQFFTSTQSGAAPHLSNQNVSLATAIVKGP